MLPAFTYSANTPEKEPEIIVNTSDEMSGNGTKGYCLVLTQTLHPITQKDIYKSD